MHSNSHLIPSQHCRKNDVYPQIHAQMQLKMDQRHNLEQSIQSCSSVCNNQLGGLHEGIRHENSETRYVPQDLKSNATIQNNRAYNGCSSISTSPSNNSKGVRRSRSLVSKSWNVRFQELIRFRETFDHCFVPHKYPENPKLSQWVRKQRHQRKRKERGLHSTLSDEREQILTNAGFIWDSHRAQWHERYQSLEIFHMTNGHCNVPSNYHDSSLSNWVKNQRKQYKLYKSGKLTAMDEERIDLLNSLSFNWDPRNLSPNL